MNDIQLTSRQNEHLALFPHATPYDLEVVERVHNQWFWRRCYPPMGNIARRSDFYKRWALLKGLIRDRFPHVTALELQDPGVVKHLGGIICAENREEGEI